jgi:hypothetical protein
VNSGAWRGDFGKLGTNEVVGPEANRAIQVRTNGAIVEEPSDDAEEERGMKSWRGEG